MAGTTADAPMNFGHRRPVPTRNAGEAQPFDTRSLPDNGQSFCKVVVIAGEERLTHFAVLEAPFDDRLYACQTRLRDAGHG